MYGLGQEGKRGPSPALWWVNDEGDEVKWSFREVTDLSCRAANVFTQTCGLQPGDRLALILPRVPEWWLVTMGCMRTGQYLRDARRPHGWLGPAGPGILATFSSLTFLFLHSPSVSQSPSNILLLLLTPSLPLTLSNRMS